MRLYASLAVRTIGTYSYITGLGGDNYVCLPPHSLSPSSVFVQMTGLQISILIAYRPSASISSQCIIWRLWFAVACCTILD